MAGALLAAVSVIAVLLLVVRAQHRKVRKLRQVIRNRRRFLD